MPGRRSARAPLHPHLPSAGHQLRIGGVAVTIRIGRQVDRLHRILVVTDVRRSQWPRLAPLPLLDAADDVVVAVVDHVVVRAARRADRSVRPDVAGEQAVVGTRRLDFEVEVIDDGAGGARSHRGAGRIAVGHGDAQLPASHDRRRADRPDGVGHHFEVVPDAGQEGGVIDRGFARGKVVVDQQTRGRVLDGVRGADALARGPVRQRQNRRQHRPAVTLLVVADDPDRRAGHGPDVDRTGKRHLRVVGSRVFRLQLFQEVRRSGEGRLHQRAGDVGDAVIGHACPGRVETLGEVVADDGGHPGDLTGGERSPEILVVQHGIHGEEVVVVTAPPDRHRDGVRAEEEAGDVGRDAHDHGRGAP